jgi:hypothetical protein
MCDGKHECQRAKELINEPETCSLEQIEKCHGDEKWHPCIAKSGNGATDE